MQSVDGTTYLFLLFGSHGEIPVTTCKGFVSHANKNRLTLMDTDLHAHVDLDIQVWV